MIRSWSLKLVLRFNWPWGCVNTESNFDWPPPVEVLAFCQQVTDKQTDQHFRIITRSTLSSMDYSPSLHCPNNLIPATFQCLWTRRYLHCVLSLSHNKSPHRNTIMLKHHISAESSIMWLAVPYERNSTNLGYKGNQHPWSVSDHLLHSILHHNTSKCETSHTT